MKKPEGNLRNSLIMNILMLTNGVLKQGGESYSEGFFLPRIQPKVKT